MENFYAAHFDPVIPVGRLSRLTPDSMSIPETIYTIFEAVFTKHGTTQRIILRWIERRGACQPKV